MLPGPVEDERGDESAEQPAKCAADRHHQIEAGQMLGRGPGAVHLAMQGDGNGEQHHEAGAELH